MIESSQDPMIALLSGTLGRASLKASLTVSNLANVDTPGFRAREARFIETLGGLTSGIELARTHGAHAVDPSGSGRGATIKESPTDRMRDDGNTVDVDREMTELAALSGRYRAATQLVKKRFALIRYALSEGRGG